MLIVYFSSTSGYTDRFVKKVTEHTQRLPLRSSDPEVTVDEPFVLVTPTYRTNKRVVPPQVIKFLNKENNRKHLKGVVGAGNKNFNADYCMAAKEVSRKCEVPFLYDFELLGTPEDVENMQTILKELDTAH